MENEQVKAKLTTAVLTQASGLKRFAMSLCRNETDSEELVANTVVKAFENFAKLKDHDKIKQWLFRILHNLFLSHYRHKKRVQLIYSMSENAAESFSLFEEISKRNLDGENPEKTFINAITQETIKNAIDELPDEFKISLVLCDVEDFSYDEIAKITKVPVGTVRSRISRARTILQKKLWREAEDFGIKKSKTIKEPYVCTCGKEEGVSQNVAQKTVSY